MKSSHRKGVEKALMAMAMYYDKSLESNVVDIYHHLLAEYTEKIIRQACSIWMKENQWHPKANEIISVIENRLSNKLSLEAQAVKQWNIVMQAVRSRGLHAGAPHFIDRVTDYLIINQFSWWYLCGMEEQNENWEQKRWVEAYGLATESYDKNQIEAPREIKKLLPGIGEFIEPADQWSEKDREHFAKRGAEPADINKIKPFPEDMKNEIKRTRAMLEAKGFKAPGKAIASSKGISRKNFQKMYPPLKPAERESRLKILQAQADELTEAIGEKEYTVEIIDKEE